MPQLTVRNVGAGGPRSQSASRGARALGGGRAPGAASEGARRRGDLTGDDLAEAVDVLKAAPVAVPVSMRRLAASALRLAVDLGHPACDCYYLALAMQDQYPVTSDTRFYDRVREHPYLSDRIVHVARA